MGDVISSGHEAKASSFWSSHVHIGLRTSVQAMNTVAGHCLGHDWKLYCCCRIETDAVRCRGKHWRSLRLYALYLEPRGTGAWCTQGCIQRTPRRCRVCTRLSPLPRTNGCPPPPPISALPHNIPVVTKHPCRHHARV